jgi:hypothetical protein
MNMEPTNSVNNNITSELRGLLHDTMNSNNKVVYEGEINQPLIIAFAKLIENKLEQSNENVSVIKKVYHVIVECLQNICKHSDYVSESADASGYVGNGLFLVSEESLEYIITTGNIISKEKMEKLKSILDMVNSLTAEEIKAMYLKQMKEGSISERGGAGLGFLDMAKKTGNKFVYKISASINDNFFFILKTTVSKK